ncbi:hypothetical protein ACJMK2_039235 [Sinanodonta woodiana]|uniref:VWFD domain-containing protein n=1 Tax=Sinanodonta woodiana TaxID=1069815 RepID=A0ABD3WBI4_SINWO
MALKYTVLVVLLTGVSTQDECVKYATIPHAGQRYYNYRVNSVIVHDFDLTSGWYRANDEIMPIEKPKSLYRCGTQFPIWMNGTLPSEEDGIVDSVACVVSAQSACSINYPIKVKNCGTFWVYFLTKTASRQEAYCFGIGTEGELPNFVPPKPVVSPVEVVKQGEYDVLSRVHFACTFAPSTDPSEAGLHYQVYWYVVKDGSEVMHVMEEQPKDKLDDLQLTEEIFMDDMKQVLGVDISCAVLPLSGKKGVPGSFSQRSEPFFAGIHIHVTKSSITRGDTGSVSVTSTIPVGCDGKICPLPVLAYVPDECEGLAFGTYCGTEIANDQWNITFYISITTSNGAAYKVNGKFDIYLKIENFIMPRIWNNYPLQTFSVEIVESKNNIWKGKTCHSHNDPHMKTFTDRYFENHVDGEFILYRHLRYKAEVQIKTRPCEAHWAHFVRCNCGVAVKAGKDVFVFDVCGPIPFIGYKDGRCKDSTLVVLKTGNTYKISFPYGTYVSVSIWSHDTRFVNVDVTPSISDDNMTSTGLCGAISTDCSLGFRKRDGSVLQNGNGNCATDTTIENAFIEEWRVWANESLFTFGKDVEDNLVSWPSYVCACRKRNTSLSQVDTQIPCGGETTQECEKGDRVGKKTCNILHQRRRRSVRNVDRFPSPRHRKKRYALNQLPVQINMTDQEALTYCQNYMKESPIFDLCNTVPSTRSEENINTCVMDILLTKTTVWADSARESMRKQCLNEISRNNTFREEEEEATGIIAEIEEKACPSMCNKRGLCVNGTCICDAGYGSYDCSLDLSEPPDIFGLLDDGLCDERHLECKDAFVYGEIFAEGENLTCRIKPFIVSVDQIRKYETAFYVPAEHETLFEVVCPVQQTRRRKRSLGPNTDAQDRFVLGYTVSVSNDRERYGRDFDLYMYNSECQHFENSSETIIFTLMDGYCFIDHKCVGSGEVHKEDECKICDDKQLKFDWSIRENYQACIRNEQDSSQQPSLTTLTPRGSSAHTAFNLVLVLLSALLSGINIK